MAKGEVPSKSLPPPGNRWTQQNRTCAKGKDPAVSDTDLVSAGRMGSCLLWQISVSVSRTRKPPFLMYLTSGLSLKHPCPHLEGQAVSSGGLLVNLFVSFFGDNFF